MVEGRFLSDDRVRIDRAYAAAGWGDWLCYKYFRGMNQGQIILGKRYVSGLVQPTLGRIVILVCAAAGALRCAEPAPDEKGTVNTAPVVVEESKPKGGNDLGPRWKKTILVLGFILKLEHPTHTETLMFGEGDLLRAVSGTKAVQRDDRTTIAGFIPRQLKWRVEDDWLVFYEREDHRFEALGLVQEGWFMFTTERCNGENLRFRITKPPKVKPI
jgi:hypothetical protein